MDAKVTRAVIERAGGDRAFAKLLGLIPESPGIVQRINNWKRRGLPAAVHVEHFDLLRDLVSAATKESRGKGAERVRA
jgi:hypothetical protein